MFFRAFILTLALGFSSNVFFYHSAWALDALPDNNSSFTHTLELKPIPHNYQIAKATFLPDRYDDLGLSDYDSIKSIQPDRNCESYTLSSCPSGGLCERCPFDVRKFRAYACKAPYLMSNGDCVCPAETPLIYPNDKCTLYCGSRCIKKSCTPSANKTNCTNSTQNCDNGCGQNTRKCCVPCTHKLTSKPANSSYTYCSCTDDSGTKQIQCGCTCNAGYHLKNGTCGSGGICEKDCIANTCSGYTLATCPAHANCTSCSKQTTGCTGGGTVFKMTGCQSGYHQSGNTCVAHSYTCPSGYQASSSGMTNPTSTPKVCSCGATSGSCYKESHSHSYSCPSGYQASACSSSQVQTGTTSKKCSCGATSGTCYACRAKTCAEQGKKDCNGSCIATSECCGGCPSGKKCSNGTCVDDKYYISIIVYLKGSTGNNYDLSLRSDGCPIGKQPFSWIDVEYGSKHYDVQMYPKCPYNNGPQYFNETTSCYGSTCTFSFYVKPGSLIRVNTYGDLFFQCGYPTVRDGFGNTNTDAEEKILTPQKNTIYYFEFNCTN